MLDMLVVSFAKRDTVIQVASKFSNTKNCGWDAFQLDKKNRLAASRTSHHPPVAKKETILHDLVQHEKRKNAGAGAKFF